MGILIGLISLSFKLILLSGLLLFGLTLLPDHLFGDLKFDPQPRETPVVELPASVKIIQTTANQITKLNLDRPVTGPESLKFHNGFIYAGTSNGQIVKIDEKTKKVTVLTRMVDLNAKECENKVIANKSCGRALDLEIVGNTLYAVDTYRGFIEYDLIKNTKISYDLREHIPGYQGKDILFNSIREDPFNRNIVYLSLSSTKYNFDRVGLSFLEFESSGILIAVNKITKIVTVIGKDFHFGNGVEITDDKRSMLVNELCNQRILKYDLKEIDSFVKLNGKSDLPKSTIFKDKMPGLPDNLTKHGKNILAALVFYQRNICSILDQIVLNVHIRKLSYRLMYIGNELVKLTRKFITCDCLDQLQHKMYSGAMLTMSLPYKSAVAILDQRTGAIQSIIELPLQYITHAIYNQETSSLYLGSIVHDNIHKLNIKI